MMVYQLAGSTATGVVGGHFEDQLLAEIDFLSDKNKISLFDESRYGVTGGIEDLGVGGTLEVGVSLTSQGGTQQPRKVLKKSDPLAEGEDSLCEEDLLNEDDEGDDEEDQDDDDTDDDDDDQDEAIYKSHQEEKKRPKEA